VVHLQLGLAMAARVRGVGWSGWQLFEALSAATNSNYSFATHSRTSRALEEQLHAL